MSRDQKLDSLVTLSRKWREKLKEIKSHIASTHHVSLYENKRLWDLVEVCKDDLVKYSMGVQDLPSFDAPHESQYTKMYGDVHQFVRDITKMPGFSMLGEVLYGAFELGNGINDPPKAWKANGGTATTVWKLWVALLKLQRYPRAVSSLHWRSFGYFQDEDEEVQSHDGTSERKRKRSINSDGSSSPAASSPASLDGVTLVQPTSAPSTLGASTSRDETPLPRASTTGGSANVSAVTAVTSLPTASTAGTPPRSCETVNDATGRPPPPEM
jgi:hypothetical protein